MKHLIRLILGAVAGVLLLATASLCAPLSIQENIRAILADKSGVEGGFSFVVIGDSRSGDKVYARLLEIAASYKPLFILSTGDMVNAGSEGEFKHYAKQLASLQIPIVHVPGNHDISNGRANYAKFFGPAVWYFDYGNYRFIGLDNAGGGFSAETIAFAQKALKTDKTCFVAFHKPPDMDRWKVHAMKSDGAGGRGGELLALIENATVPYVFLGHIHLYDEIDYKGTKYVISAGGGAPLYSQYGFGRAEYGFVVVHVGADGISHEWIPLLGQD